MTRRETRTRERRVVGRIPRQGTVVSVRGSAVEVRWDRPTTALAVRRGTAG